MKKSKTKRTSKKRPAHPDPNQTAKGIIDAIAARTEGKIKTR